MKNKQIIFNVELARPTKVKQGAPPTVFTNDTNTVEFIFNVTDFEVPETATAEVNIFMRDGSFFQKDALVEGSEIRYTLSDTEGKHAGMAQIQMTLSYENKRYSTSIFQFKIDSGLNDKVAVEVLIQDWDSITTEARQYLEQMADYKTEFSEIIADAQTQVNANVVEGAVENKFNALEAEYAQDITSLKQSDISLTAQLQQTEQELSSQLAQTNGRLDTIIVDGTPTEGNAMLLDAAVSASGVNQGSVGTNIRKTQTGESIQPRAIQGKHLAKSSTPRSMQKAETYPTTHQEGVVAIYNEPFSAKGEVDISFYSGKNGLGELLILEKQGTTDIFSILKTIPITVTTGLNTVETEYLSKGDGSEYVGFYNAGLKVTAAGENGKGRFEYRSNPTSTFTASNYTTQNNWEFGYEVTFTSKLLAEEAGKIAQLKKDLSDLPIEKFVQKPLGTNLTPYATTYKNGIFVIPNYPLEKIGKTTVTFLSGMVSTGKIFLLKKQEGSNQFEVLESIELTTSIGTNSVSLKRLTFGDGTEFVGFWNVGLRTNTNSSDGLGRYENSTYDGATTPISTNALSTSKWEYGFQLETSLVSGMSEVVQLREYVANIDVPTKEVVPFDLLRFEKTIGNFPASPNVYFFGKWFNKNIDGVDYVSTINMGSQIFAKVQGTNTVKVRLKNNSSVAGYISVSVDGGAFVRHLVADEITIATDLSSDEHHITIMVSSLHEGDTKWASGMGCNFKELVVDNGGIVVPTDPYNRFALYYGDSITEGISVLGGGGTVHVNCAEQAFPSIASALLNTACIRVGHGATGITRGGNGGVPKLLDQIDYCYSGVRESAQRPDYIVINHGQNDLISDLPAYKAGYIKVIEKLRRKFPGVYIFCMCPFSGKFATQVQEVSSMYENTVYVNTSGWNPTTSDGVHLNAEGHLLAGAKLAQIIKEHFGHTYFLK